MKNLADHISDIVHNSIAAKATLIEVIVEENKSLNLYSILIKDNGVGMSEEMIQQAVQPFFTTRNTRKIGLGLSLLKQNVEQAEGEFELKSKLGKGTIVTAAFKHNHFDRPAIGNLAETFILLMISNEKIDFRYKHITQFGEYMISSVEILNSLGGVSIMNKEIWEAVKSLIENNLTDIKITT